MTQAGKKEVGAERKGRVEPNNHFQPVFRADSPIIPILISHAVYLLVQRESSKA